MILSKQIQEESLEEAVTAGSLPWFLRPPSSQTMVRRESCALPPPTPEPSGKGEEWQKQDAS